ncbi:MAG: hypothetical protein COT22_08135 [Ignavibacteria bacterium CG08_land_8_20_14_0_20_37_9]|nr:MAG: hypothetical protein COT22_08135 [Ignavibacteria bacterium CG08_land_8_20_14_0_20_37_9]
MAKQSTILRNMSDNTKSLEKSISSLTAQIDSLNGLTQTRFDSTKVINNKKVEIKNYYTAKSNEIDSLKSDSAFVHYIRLQLQSLRSVKQLYAN